jgi:hypothetical protein
LMIQPGVIHHLQNRMHGACFRIFGAIHQATQAGVNQRSRTHRAGLNCSKEFAGAQTMITDVSAGFAEGQDFGMGGGITVG